MKIKLYNQFLESKSETKPAYEYGCSMVSFPLDQISKIQDRIDEEDIYNDPENPTRYGLEKNPHVTLLYGFHDGWEHENLTKEQVDDILDISSNFSEDPIILDNVSLFKSEEYDVLKLDAKSDDLFKINSELSEKYDWEKFYPEYHPHCTIAYLNPGKGDKYVQKFKDLEFEVIPSQIIYSRPDSEGKKEKFTKKILSGTP